MCNREISSRRVDCFFREALRPSGADRQGGRTPPPPPLAKVAKYGKRARVNCESANGGLKQTSPRNNVHVSFWRVFTTT